MNKELYIKVKAILTTEWDPIGVRDFFESDELCDEYDSYIPQIINIIDANDIEELKLFLNYSTDSMGVTTDYDLNSRVASRLISLYL